MSYKKKKKKYPMLLHFLSFLCKKTTHEIVIDDELIPNITSKLIHDPNAFVRELLSNSMDANRKLVIAAQQSDADTNRDIVLRLAGNVFTIRDRGIGMSRQELIDYIGTLGGSGTRAMGEGKCMTGKFGMGFYSVFVVAKEVRVITRKYGEDGTYMLVFRNHEKTFTVEEVAEQDECGTTVELVLEDAFVGGLDEKELKTWIKNNLIEDPSRNYAIRMIADHATKTDSGSENEEASKNKEDKDKETNEDNEDKEINEDNENKEGKDKETGRDKEGEKLKLFPWVVTTNPKDIEEYYKNIDGPGKVLTSSKMRVTIAQKNDHGVYRDVGFELLVVIPEFLDMRVLGMETKGKHCLFVDNQRVEMEKVPAFLGPVTFILKSSEAFLLSTRERLLNSKDTCDALFNSVQKKVVQLLKMELKKDIKKVMLIYDFYLKTGYLEAKRDSKPGLAETFAGVLPFSTSTGPMMLRDFVDGLKEGDDIFYASVNEDTLSLPASVHNPLFDGIGVPFILVSGLLDEQVVSSLEYGGRKMVNVMNKEFRNRTVTDDEPFIAFCRKELKGIVDDVVMSTRLISAPFFVRSKNAQFSEAHKRVIGEYVIKHSAFKKTIETDVVLEINSDTEEIRRIKAMIDTEYDKAVAALRTGVMAAAVIGNVPCSSVKAAFLSLVNVQRSLLGMEGVPVVIEEEKFDFEKERETVEKDIEGIEDTFRGYEDDEKDEGEYGRIDDEQIDGERIDEHIDEHIGEQAGEGAERIDGMTEQVDKQAVEGQTDDTDKQAVDVREEL